MASRAAALEGEVAAPEEEWGDYDPTSGVPMRRRARGDEQTVLCLGKTKLGDRCARARREVFCAEHADQWTYLPDDLQAALRDLAHGGDALDAAVWDGQFRVVQEFVSTLEQAESVKLVVSAAEAGGSAVLEARAEFKETWRDGAERLAGAHARTRARVPGSN